MATKLRVGGTPAPNPTAGPSSAADPSPQSAQRPTAPRPAKIAKLHVPAKEIQRFARNLQLQLQAGVPIIRALEVQIEDDDEDPIAHIIRDVGDQLQAGTTFGEALDRYSCFPPLFPSMVRAGEASGRMPEILQSLADHLQWTEKIRRAIRKAITYPVVVLSASTCLILFILGFLMPSFEPLFAKVEGELPASAQFLRVAGAFVAERWLWIIVAIAVGIVGTVVFAKSRVGQRAMLKGLSGAPMTSEIVFQIDMARLMRNMSVLLSAGIPLAQALALARPSIATGRLGGAIEHIEHEIEGGAAFRDAASETGVFSRLAMNLIVVGEESGRLPDMFGYIGEHHDEVFTDKVDRALKLIEPAITLGLGLVVGGMAVTIIMTIYKAVMLAGR